MKRLAAVVIACLIVVPSVIRPSIYVAKADAVGYTQTPLKSVPIMSNDSVSAITPGGRVAPNGNAITRGLQMTFGGYTHAQSTLRKTSASYNQALIYPFNGSNLNWRIITGYNTPSPSDHNCAIANHCYETDSLDFVPVSASAQGQPVVAPASGTVAWMDPSSYKSGETWDSGYSNCMSIQIDNYSNYYLMICHVQFSQQYKSGQHVDQGSNIGMVGPKDVNSSGPHIHITLYYASSASAGPTERSAVAFADPWSISGCSYPSNGQQGQYQGTSGLPNTCPTGGTVPPASPYSLTASANGQTSIHLTWQESDSVDSFKIYRDNAPQSPLGTVSGSTRQFDDSNALRCHTPYWYHVVATKNGVDSSQGTVPAQTADCSSSNPTPPPSGGNANFTLTSPSYNVQTNQQVNVTIHLHVNSGQFQESTGDHLYGLDSNLYGAYLIQPIKGTVSAGQDFDFQFNETAPGSPGTYTTHWQMKVGGNLIGNPATVTINASSPPPPPPPPGNMHVEYFRDTGLGDRCYDGYENSTYVSKDWGDGAPNSNCPVDHFGARFTETLSFPGGQYRFHCQHDDACRIYIDGDKKLDEPSSGGHDWSGNVSSGNHEIRIEFYDNTGGAHIDAWWQGPGYLPSDQDCSAAPTQWCAWYWLNRTLSGTPAVIQLEGDSINHTWNGSSPFPTFPSTNFSARFTRQAAFDCGTYRFHVFADDGVRLYIDDVLQPQFDQWHDPSGAHYYGDIALTGGTHNLRVEYYQAGGWDGLQVDWAKTSDVGPSCATATPTATPMVVSVEDVSTSDMSHTRTTTFNTGDTIIFGIDATNHGATTQPSTWSWQTVDAFGTEIAALSVDSWQYSMPSGSGGAGWQATIPANLPSGTYTLIGRVTIGDASDAKQVGFTVHNTRPAPPTLLSPSTGAIVNQSDPLTLSWSSSNGQMFAVEVATDSNFSTIVGESYWASSATSFTLSTPPSYMEAGTYYWHVKTRVGSIESAWSDTWSFTVQGIATTATATAQSTTATVQPPNVQLGLGPNRPASRPDQEGGALVGG